MSVVPRCGWCGTHEDELPDGDGLVLVGVHEGGSGPGAAVRACRPCAVWHGILPASQCPPGWMGEVRYLTDAASDEPADLLRAVLRARRELAAAMAEAGIDPEDWGRLIDPARYTPANRRRLAEVAQQVMDRVLAQARRAAQ